MTTYNKEHLYQCVRNLFAQAKYEFRAVHKIEYTFPGFDSFDSNRSRYRCEKVCSFWEDSSDCFYSTVLEIESRGGDILITFAVYVNFSNYTLWWPVGSVPNSKDVMKWLDEPGSLSKCLGLADQIIDEIHDAMY